MVIQSGFAVDQRNGYTTSFDDCNESSCIPVASPDAELSVYRDMVRTGWSVKGTYADYLNHEYKRLKTIIDSQPKRVIYRAGAGCGTEDPYADNSSGGPLNPILPPDKALPRPESNDAGSETSEDISESTCQQEESCSTVFQYLGSRFCLSFSEEHIPYGLVSNHLHSGLVLYAKGSTPDILVVSEDFPPQWFTFIDGHFNNVAHQNGLDNGFDAARASILKDEKGSRLLLFGASSIMQLSNQGSDETPLWVDSKTIEIPFGKSAIEVGGWTLVATEEGTRLFPDNAPRVSLADSLAMAKDHGVYDVGEGSAFALFDYNQDGMNDIYLANITHENVVLESKGNAMFEHRVDTGLSGDAWISSRDADWVSFNPNHEKGLYVTNEGNNHLFIRDQDGNVVDVAPNLGIAASGRNTTSAWGDFLGIKYPALYIGRSQQSNLFYVPLISDATQNILRYDYMATSLGLDINAETVGAEWLDVNSDGLMDLVVATREDGLFLFINKSTKIQGCEND